MKMHYGKLHQCVAECAESVDSKVKREHNESGPKGKILKVAE